MFVFEHKYAKFFNETVFTLSQDHLERIKKQRESIREVFPASPFSLAKQCQVFFFLASAKWSSSSKAAVYGGAGCLPDVDLRRFEGLVATCRHDEPVGDAMLRKLMHIAFTEWCVPSPTNFSFNCSKTAKLREPPVLETGLSTFLTRFIGHGHFWVVAVCFRS